ncbi:MAG: DNA polymerase I [Desulfovibrionaceae bacterium]|nr:DNA polymerase I [Desulfovibrionaceae bacterium]
MSLKERLGFAEEPLFLLDGTAFLYRFFFTGRNMQRSDGFPTNILVGMTRLLLRIQREEHPRYFLFVRDGHGKNFRHTLYPKYKANRDVTPEDLVRQVEPTCQIVEAMGLPTFVTEGYEADDCIASLAARFSQTRPVVIISGDKDLKQCLTENVVIWNLAAKEETITTRKSFEEETGYTPEQWPDVQALIGDKADNIPGVAGIGEKTAPKIFSLCSSLEDIRDNMAKLPVKIAQKINHHVDEMFIWRSLTRLATDYPREWSLDELTVGRADLEKLRKLADEYELVALKRDIESQLKGSGVSQEETKKTADLAEESQKVMDVQELNDPSALPVGDVCAFILSEKESLFFASRVDGQIWECRYTGSRAALWTRLAQAETLCVFDSLKKFLAEESPLFPNEKLFDLGLACYLLRPEDTDFSWDHLERYFRPSLDAGSVGHGGVALLLYEHVAPLIEANELTDLYRKVELPLVSVLFAMEQRGIAIDKAAFQEFLTDVERDLEGIRTEIYTLSGTTFNIRSSQQLSDVLFTKLGLEAPGKKGQTGQASTSQQVLEKLKGAHPVIEPILKFRKLEKLRSTYLEPFPKLVDAQGRLHTTFNQMGTATGRLSSSDPNLQNIPVRGDLGSRMRSCFVAEPGKMLVSSDYSQIELRVLAHLSQDPVLLDAFARGLDIHAQTAAVIYNKPLDSVTRDERRSAKTINFGLLYGMGALKLARELSVSTQEAKRFIENYFARLTVLKEFYDDAVARTKRTGYAVTLLGRRRSLPDIHSSNTQLASQAGRQAINTMIQGSAADIIKIAMLRVAHDEKLSDCRLLLQIHDELLLEVPKERAQEAGKRVAECMESAFTLSVPLVADWGFGETWALAH